MIETLKSTQTKTLHVALQVQGVIGEPEARERLVNLEGVLASVGLKVVPETLYHVRIYLADDEWGNELMRKVAANNFASRRDIADRLMVEVHEHAGWFLAFLADGTTVGTANDRAVFGGKAAEFHNRAREASWITLPEIRRQKERA